MYFAGYLCHCLYTDVSDVHRQLQRLDCLIDQPLKSWIASKECWRIMVSWSIWLICVHSMEYHGGIMKHRNLCMWLVVTGCDCACQVFFLLATCCSDPGIIPPRKFVLATGAQSYYHPWQPMRKESYFMFIWMSLLPSNSGNYSVRRRMFFFRKAVEQKPESLGSLDAIHSDPVGATHSVTHIVWHIVTQRNTVGPWPAGNRAQLAELLGYDLLGPTGRVCHVGVVFFFHVQNRRDTLGFLADLLRTQTSQTSQTSQRWHVLKENRLQGQKWMPLWNGGACSMWPCSGKLAVGSFTRRGTLRRPLHGCCKHGQGLPGPHLLGHRRTEAKECLHSIQSSIFLSQIFSSIETPQSSATRPEHTVHKQFANMLQVPEALRAEGYRWFRACESGIRRYMNHSMSLGTGWSVLKHRNGSLLARLAAHLHRRS